MTAPHEVTLAFREAGLPLHKSLVEMLDEHCVHRTERRGCGYTQATRFLSTFVNQPRDPLNCRDLGVFAELPRRECEWLARRMHQAGWASGWRALDEAPAELLASVGNGSTARTLIDLPRRLRQIGERVERDESRLWTALLEHVLTGKAPPAPDVPGMPDKPEIGSCSQAEEFFLEIAHERVRRGGQANVVCGADGQPLFVEKVNLGESHSAIVISPVRINAVLLPPGSLCALRYVDAATGARHTRSGTCLPLACIAQARFLRFTTLATPPGIRRRAFSAQVDAQLRSGMLSPLDTTLEQLASFAHRELASTS